MMIATSSTAPIALNAWRSESCVVEYDSWFWDSLVDVTVLVWTGPDEASAVAAAERELDALHVHLSGHDERLPDDGSVRIACVVSTAEDEAECVTTARIRVCEALGTLLRAEGERPLRAKNTFIDSTGEPSVMPEARAQRA